MNTPQVQAVLSQGPSLTEQINSACEERTPGLSSLCGALERRLPYLVKTDQVQLTAHVDPLRTDAKDADALQTPLRVHDADRHGRR